MFSYRSLRDLDWGLLVITLTICALGVLQIFSAAHGTSWRDAWWKQMLYLAAGLVLLWIFSEIDYHTLLNHAYLLYGVGVVLLIVVMIAGDVVFGSRRWIRMPGGFTLQVSEFIKTVLILVMARFLTDLRVDRLELREFSQLFGLFLVPFLLVRQQPDLGTALTYLPILAVGVFIAGLRWQYVASIVLIVALVLPIGWFLLAPYQKQRLTTFLNPDEDPRGAGYQLNQSKIAVGQGGMWGRGVTQGSQTQLRFLPVAHTDFIFSSFGEEHGFVGVVVVLGLYFLLVMQIVQNAQMAPDRAGMYICMGVCALLLFHVLVNVGMVVGRMPVTGIPLPLMSSGGSSLLSIFIMLGLVNNIRLRRFVN